MLWRRLSDGRQRVVCTWRRLRDCRLLVIDRCKKDRGKHEKRKYGVRYPVALLVRDRPRPGPRRCRSRRRSARCRSRRRALGSAFWFFNPARTCGRRALGPEIMGLSRSEERRGGKEWVSTV